MFKVFFKVFEWHIRSNSFIYQSVWDDFRHQSELKNSDETALDARPLKMGELGKFISLF